MKRLITSLAALLAATPFYAQVEANGWSVQESYSWSEGMEKPTEPSGVNYQFFDAEGNPVMESSYSTTVNTFENGMKVKSQSYSSNWQTGAYEAGSYTEYEYDAEGLLVKTTSCNASGNITGYVAYENYVNGLYSDMKSMDTEGNVTYWRAMKHTFENGLLTSTVEYSINGDTRNALDSIVYTYVNGVCTTKATHSITADGIFESEPAMTETYTYTADGKLASVNSVNASRWGVYISETDYKYNALSASYVPQNLAIKESATNVLEISWNAVSGATGYKVIVDGVLNDVIETAYTTDVLINGMHMIAVAAVVGDEIKNLSNIEFVTVEDKNVLPPTDFTVVEIKDPVEDVLGTTTYPVVFAWYKPESTSEILSYGIYYYDRTWNSSSMIISVPGDQTSAEVELSSWLCETYGEDGIEGKDLYVHVIAVYATGSSDWSNEIVVNAFNKEWKYSAIESVVAESNAVVAYPNPAIDVLCFSAPVSVTIYNVAGTPVLVSPETVSVNVNGLAAGYYIVKTVDAAGNAAVQTVIVK